MSDQVTQVKIELSAEDRASNVVKSFRGEIEKAIKSLKDLAEIKIPDKLKAKLDAPDARAAVQGFEKATEAARKLSTVQSRASRERRADARSEANERQDLDLTGMKALRNRFGFEARMRRQRRAEEAATEAERRTIEAATMRDLRDRLAFSLRMNRQRTAEAREAERAEAAANRSRLVQERQFRREQEKTYRDAATWASKAFSRSRESVREITRPPAAVAAAGTAGAVAGTRRVLRAEGDVDAAEVNTRSYGGLSADAARSLRDLWASPLAESLGTQTDKLLTAWTDAVKLGIPAAGARSFAELATKTSSAWEVPFEKVTDIFGTVNTILTGKGAPFDPDRLKSVANTLQHLAAKQSTTPERMISFLQRGAGAADVLGMSQEAGLAFGSASTSLGNQAGQSGRMFDYVASRLIELPRLTRGHGDQAKQARDLVNALGYGSAQEMEARRRRDPDSFLPDFMNRFARIKDKRKQEQAIRFFTGREWLGEFGRMVKGIDTYREAVKLAKEAKGLDAIGAVWDLHRTKLAFVFRQFRAGWLNILGEFGKVLSPMARQAGDYWLEWTAKLRAGGLQARFKAALEGLIEGLGFKNLPDLLRGVFGQPGEGTAGTIESWKSFARGFGQGLRDVADTIKSLFRAFTGSDGTPETIGRWTARILAFSAALVIASPIVAMLTAIGTAILAFTATARVAAAAWRALSLAGGAGAAPGGAPGAAGGGFLGWLRGVFRLAPAVAMPLTMDPSKEDSDRLMKRLGEWAKRQQNGGDADRRDARPRVERQSAADDWRGRIIPAAFSEGGRMAGAVERLERAMAGDRARMQLASITGSTVSALGRATSLGGTGGGIASGGAGAGFGPSGLPKAPGMNVPGWYGRGGSDGGGGSASSNPANSAASAAMLDAIAGTESGRAGYDAVLGNGKYGTPNKPVSTMTLDEAFAFGRQIKSRHGTSSALGRYQIVGNTMRAAQKAMGIDGSAIFDQAMQDRMARWIARNQGLGAWEGLKSNPGAMSRARAAMAQGGAQDVPAGGTAGFSGDVGARVSELQKTGAIANEQCVSLVKAFSGSAASVLSWRKGEAAEAGNLKPGTPIATFLNRDGSQSDRYAGGGTGTPGAGLDHAAVFKNYVRDAAGKIVGMTVAEQYKGSNGVHDKVYRFGQGRGERNGSNYHAVLGQDGLPLGSRNPMRAATVAATRATEAAKKVTALADKSQDVIDGFKSSGWKPVVKNAFGGIDPLKDQPAATTVKNAFGGIGDLGQMNEFTDQTGADEWKPGGKKTVPLPPLRPSAQALAGAGRKPGAGDLAKSVPLPPSRPKEFGPGGTGEGVGGTTIHAPVTIHAGAQSPSQIAGHLQRHVSEARNFRSHDLEPELT